MSMGQAPLRTHRHTRNFPLVAQLRQLGNIRRNPLRGIAHQELGRWVGGYYPLAVKAFPR